MAQHSYPALAHIAENLTEEGLILGPSAILARRYVPELQELLAMRSKVRGAFVTVVCEATDENTPRDGTKKLWTTTSSGSGQLRTTRIKKSPLHGFT